jgi:predicted nicotinamide N-methyase
MREAAEELLPPGYVVALRRLWLGGREVGLFQVADPNALADAVGAEDFGEDERFPYWAELWPSALALAGFVLRRGLGRETGVLELGCGLGLAGVAAALNGGQVLFTDFEPDALAFARANHALNLGNPGPTLLLDWRDPPAGLSAPLVLASDVLYERRFLAPFLDTLARVLPPGGTALVAEPGRAVAEGTVEQLEARGLARDLHLEEVEAHGRLHGVWIHELRRT